jgi:hypothetical protein
MKTMLIAIIFGISATTVNAQKKTMKSLDYFGKVKTTKFRNGDAIYEAKSKEETRSQKDNLILLILLFIF